ncbi:MAG: hypothetical protein MESAZ_01457 [Saezia sanguinis]
MVIQIVVVHYDIKQAIPTTALIHSESIFK